MSRAVAMASAALRRLAAASRPMIVTRAISTAPVAIARPVLLFRRSPAFVFPKDLSRGYARGRRIEPDSDDADFDDADCDEMEFNDQDSSDEGTDFNWEADTTDKLRESDSDSE